MGKYLKLGGEPGGDRWTLPDHADVEKIRAQIADAMEDEKAVRIQVVVTKNQTAELLVNGGELVAALVWEDAPAGGMNIID
jgi:hypothetical protein